MKHEQPRAILDRIDRHSNAARFAGRIPLDTHRFYLAHSPKGESPVLRLKDKEGLDEWRTRKWTDKRLFPDGPPTITDVTVQVLVAIELSLGLSRETFEQAQAWVSVEEGCRFIVTARGAAAPIATALPLWENRPVGIALCPLYPMNT